MSDSLQYNLARIVRGAVIRLPIGMSTWIARRAGDLFYVFWAKRRRIAFSNLNRVFPNSMLQYKKREIVRESFQHIAISFMELFILRKIKKEAASRFVIEGFEHLEKALVKGRGVVLVISHLGAWEYLAFLFYLTKTKVSVVVKEIENTYFDKEITILRRETGATPIIKRNSVRAILSALRQNQVVAILIDQWAGKEGIWVDFFGNPTSTTSIPARLAKKTGCALVPAYCFRKSSGLYQIQVHALIDFRPEHEAWERETTLQLNQLLEEQIHNYPGQWFWGHRRWKARPADLRA